MRPRVKTYSILLVGLCLVTVVPNRVEGRRKEITKEDAIKIAEKLVTLNGCSDLLPVKRRVRLRMNNKDYKRVLDHELVCIAFAAYSGRPLGKSGWTILFKLRANSCPECDQSEIWRAVTMDVYGRELRLERGPFHSEQIRP